MPRPTLAILHGDNHPILGAMPRPRFRLIYMDPPFNTHTIRRGRAGAFADSFLQYTNFLGPRLRQCWNLLTDDGSLFVHLDEREFATVKVWMDQTFGADCFQNVIVWAYDYGGRARKRWSSKSDFILWYTRNPKDYIFNYDAIDRIPYMAPGLVSPEKAARGKTPTNVWWQTIVPTQGKERTGYPTQKPLKLLERIVKVHSTPGDLCLDPFAGSGTFGEACLTNGRSVVLIDQNKDAISVMKTRLAEYL